MAYMIQQGSCRLVVYYCRNYCKGFHVGHKPDSRRKW